MQFKSLVAVAAVSGLAVANNSTLTTATPSVDKGCTFSKFTITASTQVQQVAACATAVGDIFITGEQLVAVDLTGVQQVFGSLKLNGTTNAVSFNAPTLQLVSGELSLSDSTVLGSVNFAQLTTVGSLLFNALPALEKAGLTSGITSAKNITISNTGLTSLEGINVYELDTFNVNNNDYIKLIDSGLQSVTNELSINYNADDVEVVMDELTLATNIDMLSIGSFSAQNLTSVNGSLSLESSSFSSFEFPKLKSIDNSLSVSKNDKLEEFDFPELTVIGGALNIQDNEELKSFSFFPKLSQIKGSVNIDGDFDNGTFPKLSTVNGGFNLTSTGELGCDEFTKLNKAGDIRGDKFYCEGASSTVSSSSSKSGNSKGTATASTDSISESSSSSGASSSSSAKSSKSGNGAPVMGVQLASFAAVFAGVGAFLY